MTTQSVHPGFHAVVFISIGHGTSVTLHDTADEALAEWVDAIFDQFPNEKRPEDFNEAADMADRLYGDRDSGRFYCEIADGVGLPNSIINVGKVAFNEG